MSSYLLLIKLLVMTLINGHLGQQSFCVLEPGSNLSRLTCANDFDFGEIIPSRNRSGIEMERESTFETRKYGSNFELVEQFSPVFAIETRKSILSSHNRNEIPSSTSNNSWLSSKTPDPILLTNVSNEDPENHVTLQLGSKHETIQMVSLKNSDGIFNLETDNQTFEIRSLENRTSSETDFDSELLTKLKWMERHYLQLSESLVDWVWPKVDHVLTTANVTEACSSSFHDWMTDLRLARVWAVKMLDACGKFPTGFLDGTVADLGSFDLCIQGHDGGSEQQVHSGQYCSVHFFPPQPKKQRFYTMFHMVPELGNFPEKDNAISHLARHLHLFQFIPLRLGLCLPSSCTTRDVQGIISTAASSIQLSAELRSCEDGSQGVLSRQQIIVLIFLLLLLSTVALGTSLDLLRRWINISPTEKSNSLTLEVLQAFSAVSNFEKLIDTQSSSDDLRALHGLRVLTISWVILSHSYLFMHKYMFRNLLLMKEGTKSLAFQVISNATITVDSFFFISGLLTTYVTLKVLRTHKIKFSIPLYIFHRYWRLTPTYLVVIGLTLLLPRLGSGPVWKEAMEPLARDCRSKWWMNLLYLNNILSPSAQCLAHSWYLPADFQFHLLSLLVILPLIRGRTWLAGFLNAGLAIGSMIATAVITWLYQFPPTELYIHPDEKDRMGMKSLVYYQFYAHTGPYCVGLTLGYYLTKRKTHKISKTVAAAGWSLSALTASIVVLATYPWNNGSLPGSGLAALYAASHRTLWSTSLAWVVFACATGNGGVVNRFLTWRTWIPLSRLTFLAYLVHPQLQWVFAGLAHERMYYSHYNMMYIFIGHLVITYLVSMVMSVTLEAPFLALEKTFFLRQMDTAPTKLNKDSLTLKTVSF